MPAPVLDLSTYLNQVTRSNLLPWTGEIVEVSQAFVVALREMIEHDPSLAILADLPLGWHAWRTDKDSKWERGPIE